MTSPQNKIAAPSRPRQATLKRTDYVLMALTALVFVAVLVMNSVHVARAQDASSVIPASQLPSQDTDNRGGLIRARIGLALAGR